MRLQGQLLTSDMSAFKAANPQADFQVLTSRSQCQQAACREVLWTSSARGLRGREQPRHELGWCLG